MRQIYTILQVALLVFLLPIMALLALFSAKYRGRIPVRLGYGLKLPAKQVGRPRIWLHALSVGEVISARPLLKALRQEIPGCELILSTVTQGGQGVAREMGGEVDHLVAFPFDLFFTVSLFIKRIAPDIFVLVETDLWPNVLWQMRDAGVPAVLVNGRIARRSFKRYLLLRPLFASILNSFTAVTMQMESGVEQLHRLGVTDDRVFCLGNLKFDLEMQRDGRPELMVLKQQFSGRLVLVAGSTHAGEEEVVIESYLQLRQQFPELLLIIAPRNVERAVGVQEMAASRGLSVSLRTETSSAMAQVLVLNTLGELVYLYALADFAFVGGSLVNERGHNPLEPAYWGKPVLFGPYMDDFAEASAGLVKAGGAEQVTAVALTEALRVLCADHCKRAMIGQKAAAFVQQHQGAAKRCSRLIHELIDVHK